jgi:hypothetical protein
VINYIKKQYKQKNPVTQRMTGFVKVASTYSSIRQLTDSTIKVINYIKNSINKKILSLKE